MIHNPCSTNVGYQMLIERKVFRLAFAGPVPLFFGFDVVGQR
jgi:hypothetical protein